MNKTELVASVAEATSLSKKDAENAVSAVIASITKSLTEGEKVQIAGFGTFEVQDPGVQGRQGSEGLRQQVRRVRVNKLVMERIRTGPFFCV